MIPRSGRYGRFEKAYLDVVAASGSLVFASRAGRPGELALALAEWQEVYAELGHAFTEAFLIPE